MMSGPNGNASMGMGSPGAGPMGGMPKGSPMGNDSNNIGGPGGPGPGGPPHFKNSPIMGGGPTTTDPNYAQQFHDFQQQLYATNTSRGMRGNGPGPGPGPMGPGPGNFYGGGPPPGAPLGP